MTENATNQKTSTKAQAGMKRPKNLVQGTIAAVRILVDGDVKEEFKPPRGDKPGKTLYHQDAIILRGADAQPVNYIQTAFEQGDVLKEGVYTFAAGAVRLNNYGSPEISRYEPLVYIGPMTITQAAKFEREETDMSDLVSA